MHSRIFQVSLKPIDKAEYITESEYYDHWFTNSVADYVNDDCNRGEDIEWLKDCYEGRGIEFGADDNGEYFIIKSRIKYFEKTYEKFQGLLEKIRNYDITEFANGIYEFWSLKEAYEDKFGFYVQTDDNGLITIDNFARVYPENTKYYIGATIDYHY